MKRKFLHDISANALQLVIVQFCGLVIFYLLSTRLAKNEFGEINWVLAVLLTAFGILAFGIDQITVRRIASGFTPGRMLSTYFTHVLLSGVLFYILLGLGNWLYPPFFKQHYLLFLLGISKLAIFLSTPFKQLATGLERFRPLLLMAVCSNVLRSIALIVLAFTDQFTLIVVVVIFIAGDIAELLLCMFIMQFIIKVPLKMKWNKSDYRGLIKEAIPQFGVSVFSSVLARFDWIFIGLFSTNIILANYSFAYKIFEVATLPMLVIAPVLIPRFTKLFHPSAGEVTKTKSEDLLVLLRLEMIIASFTVLMLNILWVPVIDFITQGKYGFINRQTILLLSLSIPFLYLNNFLWTINFAKGRLKMIFYVFLASFLINIAGDILLIPFFKAEGAALGYFVAIITQSLLYLWQTKLDGLRKNSYSVLLCLAFAVISGIITTVLFGNIWIILLSTLVLYAFLLYFSRQIRLSDWLVFRRVTGL